MHRRGFLMGMLAGIFAPGTKVQGAIVPPVQIIEPVYIPQILHISEYTAYDIIRIYHHAYTNGEIKEEIPDVVKAS